MKTNLLLVALAQVSLFGGTFAHPFSENLSSSSVREMGLLPVLPMDQQVLLSARSASSDNESPPQSLLTTVSGSSGIKGKWIVLQRSADLKTYEEAKANITSSDKVKLRDEIIDDNPDTFNALLVDGEKNHLLSILNSKLFRIFENKKRPILKQPPKTDAREESDDSNKPEKKPKNMPPYNWGHLSIAGQLNEYVTPAKQGEGVVVYVVDSGIDYSHPEFENRVKFGESFCATPPKSNKDDVGHGTHVAGIIGSRSYGVAPKVDLVSVAIFELEDDEWVYQASNLLKAIQWIQRDVRKHKKPSIVNFSIGAPVSDDEYVEVENQIDLLASNGIHVVAAAGNSASDACKVTPARSPHVLAVAASASNSTFANEFSNLGGCVDIIAPGVDIMSTGPDGKLGILSGTSQAAPFVTGVLALVLAERKFADVDDAYDYIKRIAQRDILQDVPAGTTNLFLSSPILPTCTKNETCGIKTN